MASIDRKSSEPFYQQVYSHIVAGIGSGLYPVGTRLPSIRECARELGVSNSTIELAYQQLVSEGYIEAKRGSGHVVCEVEALPQQTSSHSADYEEALKALATCGDSQPAPRYDFAYDRIDIETFPLVAWARICREVFFGKGADRACLYDEAQGLADLREEIARFVNAEQGTSWIAEQVLVMPTTRDLISQILSLFDPDTTVVAMEEPGYDEVASAIRARGFSVSPIPLRPSLTAQDLVSAVEGADIAFVTPASQFPTNHPMDLEMRHALVEWAQRTDAIIIDDEYGWELQSGIARTPSLATLDTNGHVIMTGTFSNSFTPAICLSYALLPPQLMMRWRSQREGFHPGVPWQTQAAMATLMRQGIWAAHIRKLRLSVQRKRALMRQAIEEHFGDSVECLESPNSQFLLVQTLDGRGQDELIEAAAREGIRVYPTSRYWSAGAPQSWRYVLVGFAGISADDIAPGIQALAKAWNSTKS